MTRIFTFVTSCLILFTLVISSAFAGYGAKLCGTDGYECYTAKRGDTWAKLFPNEDIRIAVMKVNRVNIGLYKGMKIAIPSSLGESFMDHAPFPAHDESTGNRYIKVSLSKLAFGAYDENGDLLYWGPISGGKGYCPDIRRGCHTPTGQFAIYNKGGAGCKSSKYPVGRGGAPMPYCMFFRGGFALHGSHDVPGYHASHGCVRISKDDAKWLNQTFTSGYSHVGVIITQ